MEEEEGEEEGKEEGMGWWCLRRGLALLAEVLPRLGLTAPALSCDEA